MKLRKKPRLGILPKPRRHRTRFRISAYPQKVRDQVQDDYFHKLTREEQEWLASFNESEYGGNPHCLENITGLPISVEEKRKLWREAKRYERDTASLLSRVDVCLYYCVIDAQMNSNEDSIIEMLDSMNELELVILENIKFTISKKEW